MYKLLTEDGHLSKDMTVEEVAEKHNVSVEELEKQVKMGIEVEHEHTSDDEEAKRIALDHLYEFPDYYTRLDKMEEEGEKALDEGSLKRVSEMDDDEKERFDKGEITGLDNDGNTIGRAPDGSQHLLHKKDDLKESVLDPVQKERCREIFDSEDKMLPEVKRQIIDRFMEWKNNLEEKFTVDQIVMIGSSTGFQYTSSSDVDITVISHDYSDEIWEKIKETMPNGNNLEGTEHPVNYFIRQDLEERKAENIYDVQEDKWLKKTDKAVIDIHMPYIVEMARFFMNAFDLTLKEYERDKMDYIQLKELDPEKVEISEEERSEALVNKLTEIKADLDSIRMGNHVLRGFLHDAYEKDDGIFEVHIEIKGGDDPRLSPNNLVYKLLERYGYREKIDSTIKDAEEFLEKEDHEISTLLENFLKEVELYETSLLEEAVVDKRAWKWLIWGINHLDKKALDDIFIALGKEPSESTPEFKKDYIVRKLNSLDASEKNKIVNTPEVSYALSKMDYYNKNRVQGRDRVGAGIATASSSIPVAAGLGAGAGAAAAAGSVAGSMALMGLIYLAIPGMILGGTAAIVTGAIRKTKSLNRMRAELNQVKYDSKNALIRAIKAKKD